MTDWLRAIGDSRYSLVLDISECGLQKLPVEVQDGMPWLHTLSAKKNRIKEIPTDFSLSVAALTQLDLSFNLLTFLPAICVASLPLQILRLRGNSLFELESEALPSSLQHLDISKNNLVVLPLMSHLVSLLEFDASENQLVAVHDSLGCCIRLETLFLNDNQLLSFPLLHLPSLCHLDLTRNQLTSLPSLIGSECRQLREIRLAYNKLESLPESLSLCSHLSSLILRGNEQLIFPPALLSLFHLSILDLEQTHPASPVNAQHLPSDEVTLRKQLHAKKQLHSHSEKGKAVKGTGKEEQSPLTLMDEGEEEPSALFSW